MSDVIKRCSNSVLSKSATKETEEACSRLYELLQAEPENAFDPPIQHFLHGGIYTRTMFLPKGCAMLGALIKVPTTCVIHGDIILSNGINSVRSTGFATYQGVPNRRCFAYAIEDTYFTTHNVSKATTLDEAQKEFTDEWYLLTTYKCGDNNKK